MLFETGELMQLHLFLHNLLVVRIQQVMSPTLGQGYGTTTHPSPPPGRDGIQVPGLTPPPAQGQSGGMGFEPNMATGGALGGIDQH